MTGCEAQMLTVVSHGASMYTHIRKSFWGWTTRVVGWDRKGRVGRVGIPSEFMGEEREPVGFAGGKQGCRGGKSNWHKLQPQLFRGK